MPIVNFYATIYAAVVAFVRRSQFAAAEIAFLCLAVGLFVIKLQQGLRLTANDWNTSEWLIDYSAGFVRRGLGGTILLFVHEKTGVDVTSFVIISTAILYWTLFIILFYRIRKIHNLKSTVWKYVILLSPNLMIFEISSGTFYRKDLLPISITFVNVILSESLLKRYSQKQANLHEVGLIFVIIGLLAIFLAANHEGLFVFLFLPVNFLICCATAHRLGMTGSHSGISALGLVTAVFIPSVVVAGLSVVWHGDQHIADSICRTWQGIARGVSCNREIPAAVGAIGWGLKEALEPVKALLLQGGIIWYLLAFSVLSLIQINAVSLISNDYSTTSANFQKVIHVTIIGISFLMALPLFLIGADWGRHFFVISTQMTFLMLSASVRNAIGEYLPPSLITPVQGLLGYGGVVATTQLICRYPRVILAAFIFIGIPAAGMTPHSTLAQSSFSIIVHVFRPSFGIE